MDEKFFNLSKLKDTLEIMQNDPYQDIYDDVETDFYLQKFFGITYNDNSESQAEKYETLRLLKILHDCIRECNVEREYSLGIFIQIIA